MTRITPVPVGRVEEERKKLILDAAADCTVEGGVDTLTLRKVASRAGVSIGMICYYFPTKNDLLIATLQKTADRIVDGTNASTDLGSPIERLRKALEIGLQPGDKGGNWAFRLAFAGRAAHEPELASFYAARLDSVKHSMAREVQNSINTGEISPNLNSALCADLLLCLNQGLGMETTIDPKYMPAARALEIFDFVISLMTHFQTKSPDQD